MSLGRIGIARNVSAMVLVQIANYLMPMVSVPIIVRIIGPEKFGLINYAAAIVGYFALLINYGFNLTATRKVAQNKSDKLYLNKIFTEVLFAKLTLFAISLLLFIGCYFFLAVFRSYFTLFLSTYLICIAWVFTPDWFYQGMQDLHRTAIFNFITKILFTLIILLLIRTSEDYYWQPLVMSLVQILIAFVSWMWAIRKYGIKLQGVSWISSWRLVWSEKTIFFSTVIISIYTTTTVVILGSIASVTEVAYYTAAQKFIVLAQALITVPLAQSLFPVVGEAFGLSKEAGLNKVRKIVGPVMVISFLAGLVMYLIGPYAIQILYGKQFEESKGLFRLMCFLPFIICISNIFGIQTMLNLKMDTLFFKITSLSAVISLLLNFLMIPFFGAWGAALTWLITEVVVTVVMGSILYRQGIKVISFKNLDPRLTAAEFSPLVAGLKKKFLT